MAIPQETEVLIVGAGIVGLAQAWIAAERGHRVVVLERDDRARGATVRNFGTIWPIGLPPGPLLEAALRSRQRWLSWLTSTGTWHNPRGSVFLARNPEEAAVMQEFTASAAAAHYQVAMLTAAQTAAACPVVKAGNVHGAMASATEVGVASRTAVHRLAAWLGVQFGVQVFHQAQVIAVEGGLVRCADGRAWKANRVVVCSGHDFAGLFPATYADSGVMACRLQMLRTVPQVGDRRPRVMVATGLTLRHYPSFAACPSLGRVQERIAAEAPELDRWGIHVMAAEHDDGGVVIGDSHDYQDPHSPFAEAAIDARIVAELARVLDLDWTIQERWIGIYAKHKKLAQYVAEPAPGVKIVHNTNGLGMTLSFGLAEKLWQEWGDAR